MSFDKLTKPRQGIYFNVGYVIVNLNWARTWVWADQTDTERTTRYISLHKVQRRVDDNDVQTTLVSLILGPAKITIGW